jgi:signal transduction histidine kinase
MIDVARQAERLSFMERDLGLPVRLVVLSILFYYLFLSDWFEGLNSIGQVALDTVRRFFLVYGAINAVAAGVYLFMHRLAFAWVRWVAFLVNFIDGLFIGVVTLVTGGLESLAYWVFLALMARNAFTFPLAPWQVSLNFLMIAAYLFAGFMDRTITRFEQSTLESLAEFAVQESDLPAWRAPKNLQGTNVIAVYSNACVFYLARYALLTNAASPYAAAAARFSSLPPANTNAALALVQAFGKYTRQYAWYTNAFLHYTNAFVNYTNAARWPEDRTDPDPRVLRQFKRFQSQSQAAGSQYNTAFLHYNSLARLIPPSLRGRPHADTELVASPTRSIYGVTEREHSAQYLLLRIFLMLLMVACCFGVQVLVDKQRLALEEAQEFRARQKQLEAAGRVAAQIAHQVKNPLAIINSAAYCLQRSKPAPPESATQQIQIIREEVARADQIITQLMGYAQLAEGRVEKLNLAEELDRAIAQVFPSGSHSPVEVEVKLAPRLPPLLMPRAHLSEILVNLLLNAREAIPGPGHITVTAGHTPDEAVEVCIRDTGPGIPPDRFVQIFEPYFSTKTRGTGLGLAIVKQNTEMYGGTVRVESVLGKGAAFVLHFPIRTFMTEPT